MHLAKPLADSVSLFHNDFEWIQTIDYEHIPFRCRKCHEHGHLFRDFPLNQKPSPPPPNAGKDSEGFTKVSSRKKHSKKSPIISTAPIITNKSNSFEFLAQQAQTEAPQGQPANSSPSQDAPASKLKAPLATATSKDSLASSSIDNQIKPSITISSLMDLDFTPASAPSSGVEDMELNVPSLLEDDPDHVDFGELEILALEEACHQK